MMLGHSDLEATTVYLHLSRRHLQATANPLEQIAIPQADEPRPFQEIAQTAMSRPAVEVADLLHKQGDRFMGQSPWLNFQQLSVLRAITRCRTAALGGHCATGTANGSTWQYSHCSGRYAGWTKPHPRQLAAQCRTLDSS
jgi:hypothetical protein